MTSPTLPDEKASTLTKADATLLPERALTAADIAAQFAAKAKAHALVGGADEPGEPAELASSARRGHALSTALADRLEAVQDALAALEREVLAAARAGAACVHREATPAPSFRSRERRGSLCPWSTTPSTTATTWTSCGGTSRMSRSTSSTSTHRSTRTAITT